LIEWWTAHWVALMRKDGELLFVERNTWGFQSWSQTFGGTGLTPTGEEFNPSHWIRQGMMFRVMETLKFLNQARVAQQTIYMRAAYAEYIADKDPAEAAKQLEGGVVHGRKEDWGIMPTPDLPANLFQHVTDMQNSFEQSTFSLIAGGFPRSNIDTATQMVIYSENTSRTFKTAVKQMEKMYGIIGSQILMLHYKMWKEYGNDYGVIDMGEDALKVSDMEEKFHVRAKFEQVDSVVAAQEISQGVDLQERGVISMERLRAIARIEDPTVMDKQVIEDRVKLMPRYMAQREINALRRLGEENLADELEGQLRKEQLVGPDGKTPLSQFSGNGTERTAV
ncbi:MAG: hypothetical protein J3T61_08285, partial [Candidatus Brocadiales bacterium]|nr:hypothetical protein [Candidatus Bathyanammoxibius sp.]